MRKIFIYILMATALVGCNDALNLLPEDELVVETTFTNYSNFKTYAWGFYSAFEGYALAPVNREWDADLMLRSNDNQWSSWIWRLVTVPTTSSDYSDPYTRIRRVNLMLDNIDGSALTEDEKKHWRSVGYFFRAYNYFDLVKKYGDVIWLEHSITESSEELKAARTPRNEVTQSMLENLTYAVENIKTDGEGDNTVGVDAVRALLARFGLFEGTWRKYHSLGDESKYLEAAKNAAKNLIDKYPNLHDNYDEVFNSESLKGVEGIILYKEYVTGQQTQYLTSRHRNSAGNWDLTKKAADMYLLIDGQTRWTSTLFDGDHDPYDEFRNRDRRLYFTVVPPFKVNTVPVGQNSSEWEHTGNAKHREYIDIMETLSDDNHKTLPSRNWSGLVVRETPHFRNYNNGQGFNAGHSGYKLFKYFNKYMSVQNQDITDAPVFRMGEVMLNYAEAVYELGEFNQTVADVTINKLRARGGVAPLTVGAEPNDPTRDQAIAPTLWEIRRERAIELMGEGYRFDDLRRWKKMDYTEEEKLGRWVNNADYGNRLKIQDGAEEGYVVVHGKPTGGSFPDYYYLYPIPSNEIVLNPNIKQNTDW
ncbi:MAG: RagB/SusD family nutrient uptake outer membrane protein [Bacteroidales bacterium]